MMGLLHEKRKKSSAYHYSCMYVCMYACMYVCMYICMYVYMQTRAYVYIHREYTYIQGERERRRYTSLETNQEHKHVHIYIRNTLGTHQEHIGICRKKERGGGTPHQKQIRHINTYIYILGTHQVRNTLGTHQEHIGIPAMPSHPSSTIAAANSWALNARSSIIAADGAPRPRFTRMLFSHVSASQQQVVGEHISKKRNTLV